MNTPLLNAARVAIIITNWDDSETTLRCLGHLAASTFTRARITVVDGGSSDASLGIIRAAYPDVELLPLGINRGHAGGANAGAAHVMKQNPEFLLFLDNDAFVIPDMIARLVEDLDGQPNAAAACPLILSGKRPGRIWYAGGDVTVFGNSRHWMMNRHLAASALQPGIIQFATSCVLCVRAEAFRAVGGFQEGLFNYTEDLDLSLRLVRAGYSLRFVPDARAVHGESVNVVKKAGKPFRDYLSMRNRLAVIRQHGSPFQRWAGIPATMFYYGLVHGAFFLLRGEWARSAALLRGTLDFFRNRSGRGPI